MILLDLLKVIAHTQEIHAKPQNNGTDSTDGKPTSAEVAEINEYSLSQLVNDTDNANETVSRVDFWWIAFEILSSQQISLCVTCVAASPDYVSCQSELCAQRSPD